MQVSTKVFNQQAIDTFDQMGGEIQQMQKKIATGKNIQKPSDDPVLAARASVLSDQLAQTEQYIRNIDVSYVKLGMADSVLEQTTNLMTRAYELSIKARSDTNKAGRLAIVVELEGILDSIRDLANSRDASGSALFGGYKVEGDPFVTDAQGNTQYQGDRGTHAVKISDSLRMATTLDGATVFQRVQVSSGHRSIFEMLDTMISDLKAGDASSLPITDLSEAVAHIADQRALIGSEMNKADNQATLLANRKLLLTENIGDMEDADLAEIVTKLQSLMVSKDAAQQAFARISQMSLFDFLR